MCLYSFVMSFLALASSGLEVRVEGFSHKLPVLTARVFSRLVDGKYEAQAFANVKEELVRKYRNMNMTVGDGTH